MRGCVLLAFLAATACGQASTQEKEDVPQVPLVPGTCVNTDCSLPAAQPLVPAPMTTCNTVEGPPITLEWMAPTQEVECPPTTCHAGPRDVAVSSDGEVWASASLYSLDPFDPRSRGLELLRHDAQGNLELEKRTHVVQPLYEPPTAHGMSVTPDGRLDWVGPSPSSSGISLLQYDRAGALTRSRWLVEHAVYSDAHFSSHGVTVGYSYVAETDATVDPPVVQLRGGIARFDRDGELVWNQTAVDGASGLGVLSDGSVMTLANDSVVKLAPDGSVSWVRSWGTLAFAAAVNPANDTFLIVGLLQLEDQVQSLDTIDATGSMVRRLVLPPVLGVNVVASGKDEILLLSLAGDPAVLVSADGTTCTRYDFDVPMGIQGDEYESIMELPSYAPLDGERFAFATSGALGVARLP